MSNSFIGEVRAFPYNFAPDGWLECLGQSVSIQQYQALFAVIGMRYGGDGRTTFGLPNLSGRVTVGQGTLTTNGQPESTYAMGQLAGVPEVTLTPTQLPPHTHTITSKFMPQGAAPNAFSNTPTSQAYASRMLEIVNPVKTLTAYIPHAASPSLGPMSPVALTVQPPIPAAAHENCQPYTTLRFCICATDGIYPPRP